MEQLIVDLSDECRRLKEKNRNLESSHRNLEIKTVAGINRIDGEIDDLRRYTTAVSDSALEPGDTMSSGGSIDDGQFTKIKLGIWNENLSAFEPGQCRAVRNLDIEFSPNAERKVWDVGALIKRYHSFERLNLVFRGNYQTLQFRPIAKFEWITSLRLCKMIKIDALAIFSLLPRLSRVDFHRVSFIQTAETTRQTCPVLRTLFVGGWENEPWLSNLSCPGLTTFIHSGYSFPISFLRSHPSVTALGYSNRQNPGILQDIESTHPGMKWLSLNVIEIFNNQGMARAETPPFPHLEHLKMNGSLDLDKFEGIVRTRCLPFNRGQSQLSVSLKPLQTLSILGTASLPRFEQSEFFKSAAQQVVTDPYWPELETVILSWI